MWVRLFAPRWTCSLSRLYSAFTLRSLRKEPDQTLYPAQPRVQDKGWQKMDVWMDLTVIQSWLLPPSASSCAFVCPSRPVLFSAFALLHGLHCFNLKQEKKAPGFTWEPDVAPFYKPRSTLKSYTITNFIIFITIILWNCPLFNNKLLKLSIGQDLITFCRATRLLWRISGIKGYL